MLERDKYIIPKPGVGNIGDDNGQLPIGDDVGKSQGIPGLETIFSSHGFGDDGFQSLQVLSAIYASIIYG